MHEHIARAMYYFSVHLMFASVVALASWGLTSILRASATTKYWLWVATVFNFVLPFAALVDKLWAPHLTWARPLGAIGVPVWNLTQGRTAVIVGLAWAAGALFMLRRLVSRIRREHRQAIAPAPEDRGRPSDFLVDGIPVDSGHKYAPPAVHGLLHPRILLPAGLERLLNSREFEAVLIHEAAHARRRDNLIRLVYETSLCALWFHPLMWLAGTRIGLYRELSCDESVIRRGHGQELISALAKLAVPEHVKVLQATASSHLSYRLACLAAAPQTTQRGASVLLAAVFAGVVVASVFQTVAHTACCFLLKP